ncbi:MAG: hypothetical protein GXO08_02865 [Aquificae bacterium]|nr:hypothetical protein [Aquificota bacterium]
MGQALHLKVVFPNGRTAVYRTFEEPDFDPVGYRVLVPLKSGKGATGVVVGRFYAEPSSETPFVDSFPDRHPVVNKAAFWVLKKVVFEYLSTLGESLFKLLPSWADWYQETFVVPVDKNPVGLPKSLKNLFEELKRRGKVPYETFVKRFDPKLVKLLKDHHLVRIKTEWVAPKAEETFLRLKVSDPEEVLRLVSRASRRRKNEVLKLLRLFEYLDLPTPERLREEGISSETLRYLEKKGVLERFTATLPPFREVPRQDLRPLYGRPLPERLLFKNLPFDRKLERLTEVLETALSEGRDALVLVPRLETLEKLWEVLRPRFGDRLLVHHSALSQKDSIRSWFAAAEPWPKVLLTTPQWLFAPLNKLGTVVLLDESAPAYKMQRSPYLNLKKLAFLLAKASEARLAVFADPPSLEVHLLSSSFVKEESKRNARRVLLEGRDPFRETPLVQLLSGRSLVLVPKRGYSNLLCRRCGKLLECPRCEANLVLETSGEVVCHLCGYSAKGRLCPRCGEEAQPFGYGVDRVRKVLEGTGAEVFTHPPQEGQFETVAVLFADALLGVPDYRKGEDLFEYLKKAENLTAEGGLFVLHSNEKDHHAVRAVLEGRDELFYETELEYRRALNLPPFSRLYLVAINLKEENEELARDLYRELKTRLFGLPAEVEFSKAPTFRLKETYRYQVLVKVPQKVEEGELKKLLKELREFKKRHRFVRIVPNPRSVR